MVEAWKTITLVSQDLHTSCQDCEDAACHRPLSTEAELGEQICPTSSELCKVSCLPSTCLHKPPTGKSAGSLHRSEGRRNPSAQS
jgi:hypothetical protein